MKSCNWILLSSVAAAAMLAAAPAAAEDADQAETAAVDTPSGGSTDIIVTATKRAQNVQDVNKVVICVDSFLRIIYHIFPLIARCFAQFP